MLNINGESIENNAGIDILSEINENNSVYLNHLNFRQGTQF